MLTNDMVRARTRTNGSIAELVICKRSNKIDHKIANNQTIYRSIAEEQSITKLQNENNQSTAKQQTSNQLITEWQKEKNLSMTKLQTTNQSTIELTNKNNHSLNCTRRTLDDAG